MKTSKLIFWGSVIIILLLILTNFKINDLKNQMKEGCTEDYSNFIETGKCPCEKPSEFVPFNFTYPNLSEVYSHWVQSDINVSIK